MWLKTFWQIRIYAYPYVSQTSNRFRKAPQRWRKTCVSAYAFKLRARLRQLTVYPSRIQINASFLEGVILFCLSFSANNGRDFYAARAWGMAGVSSSRCHPRCHSPKPASKERERTGRVFKALVLFILSPKMVEKRASPPSFPPQMPLHCPVGPKTG